MSSSPISKSLLSVPPLRLEKVSPGVPGDRMLVSNFYACGPSSFPGPASTGSSMGPPSMRGRPSTPRPKRPPPPLPPASNAGLVERPGVVAPSTLTDALRDVVVSATAPQGVRVRVPWRAVNVLLDLLSEAKSGEARVLEKHGWAKGKTWPTQGNDVATLSALVDDIEALNKPASNNKTPPGRSPPPSPPPQQKQAKPEKLAAAAALFDDDDDDDDLLDSILGKPTPVSELRTTAAPLSARGPPPAATRTQYAPHPPLTSRPLPPSPTMPTTSPTKQAAHVAAVGVLSVDDDDDDDDDDLFDDLFANTPTPPPPSRVVAPPSPIPHLPPANNGHATTKQSAGGGGDDDSDWSSDEDAEDFFNANPSGIAHGGGSKKNGKKRSPFAIKLNASPTALPTTTVPMKLSLAPPPSASGPPSYSSDQAPPSIGGTLASFLAPAAVDAINAAPTPPRSHRSASATDAATPRLSADALAALPVAERVSNAVAQMRAGGQFANTAATVLRNLVATGSPDDIDAAIRGGAVGAALTARAGELVATLARVLAASLASNQLSPSLVEVALGGAIRACEDALDSVAAGEVAAAAGAMAGSSFLASFLGAARTASDTGVISRAAAQMAVPSILVETIQMFGSDASLVGGAVPCCEALHFCVQLGGTLKGAVNRAGGKAAITELLESHGAGVLFGSAHANAINAWLAEASASFGDDGDDAIVDLNQQKEESRSRRRSWFGRGKR